MARNWKLIHRLLRFRPDESKVYWATAFVGSIFIDGQGVFFTCGENAADWGPLVAWELSPRGTLDAVSFV